MTKVRHEPFPIEPTWKLSGNDPRERAHGIDVIEVDGQLQVVWAAQNGPSVDGNWTHNIFRGTVDRQTPALGVSNVTPIVDLPGAQEPASSSVRGDYSITTWEDDSEGTLSQRYQIFRDGVPLWDAPRNAFEGGHSGHVSSARSWHAIVSSEGWVKGGGVNNLGSGEGVYLTTMNLDGSNVRAADVDSGRAWWPLTASSDETTAVVWQKFAGDGKRATLKFAAFAPADNGDFEPIAEAEVSPDVAYYEYDVAYAAERDVFVVAGNTRGGDAARRGFITVFDSRGEKVASRSGLAPFVRESKPAVETSETSGDEVRLTYPTAPTGLQEFIIRDDDIEVGERITDSFRWPTTGTAAAVTARGERYFVAFRDNGIEQLYLRRVPRPSATPTTGRNSQ